MGSLWGHGHAQDPPMSVRFSCRPFALDDLDDYEKHFTVMNYDPEVVLKQVRTRQGLGSRFVWRQVQTWSSHLSACLLGRQCRPLGAAIWYLC